ncbi:MAG: ABC transporter ATP-binding protein [Solirubrobacteraceae bacterium]|nr:ABC transporter ATP-binding protein [Solirubrobacteraceae bacterium]
MDAAALLTLTGLRVDRGGETVLDGLDLELRRGEVAVLLGPSGAGKSTLVLAAAGLIEVAGGAVEARGRVAAALQGAALARRSVRANVEAALGWWGVPRPERPGRATRALERCRAAHLADRAAGTLSGGEATRVHLARAVALDPDVLLLDEPFTALDPAVRGELLAEAGDLIRDARRATLVVLHDRTEAWAIADRLLVLLGGRIAADGAPAAILGAPPSEEVAAFLGFTGRLELAGGEILRLRPGQVTTVAPGEGDLDGTIEALIPEPDSAIARVATERGRLEVRVAVPGPSTGELVGLRLLGGARFEARA